MCPGFWFPQSDQPSENSGPVGELPPYIIWELQVSFLSQPHMVSCTTPHPSNRTRPHHPHQPDFSSSPVLGLPAEESEVGVVKSVPGGSVVLLVPLWVDSV